MVTLFCRRILAALCVTALAQAAAAQSGLSFELREKLRREIQKCWNVPVVLPTTEQAHVVLGVRFDRNGQVVEGPILLEPERPTAPETRNAFEAARRAILRCAGDGYDLPTEAYADWWAVTLTFNPRGLVTR